MRYALNVRDASVVAADVRKDQLPSHENSLDRGQGETMMGGVFRVVVLLLLGLICASQLVQGYECIDRLIIRGRIREQIPQLEALAKKAMFESPDVKGIWHQMFLQNQIAAEYLKIIAQR